ncbi:MAG: hypothetical protein ACM3KE_10820 [Hyphomicrobiales bacterium]
MELAKGSKQIAADQVIIQRKSYGRPYRFKNLAGVSRGLALDGLDLKCLQVFKTKLPYPKPAIFGVEYVEMPSGRLEVDQLFGHV